MDVLTYLLAKSQSSGGNSDDDAVKIVSLTVSEGETTEIAESQLGVISVLAVEGV